MTDPPTTTVLAAVPTRPMPTVRAHRRGHGPTPPRHWAPVIVLVVADALVAMFLVGTMLGTLFPSDLADRSAVRSPVPPPVVSDPAIGGGVSVAAGVLPSGRQVGRDGGAPPARGVTASTTAGAVVPDAAPTRGQTPLPRGPVGGPASTTTTAEPPVLPPETLPPSSAPEVPDIPSTTTGEPAPPPATTEETTT